jgi:DnaA family protein
MAQLLLDLPLAADYSAASLLPTAGTQAARDILQGFSRGIVSLWGPPGSGKTHVLKAWAARVGAAESLENAGGLLALDDLDKLDAAGQEKLFFWLNGEGLKGGLVVTSGRPVVDLKGVVADVRSRLSAGRAVELSPPIEQELRPLALKWAAERQVELPPAVVDFILARAERSVPVLRAVLERLDRLGLEEKRAVTVPLAKRVLGEA